MRRTDRLFELIRILRDGNLHRAQDFADQLKVSVRTIYRDMDTLTASGVPVEGERGVGYRTRQDTTLPPLTLSATELEALNLGIAIVAEAADPDLKSAAQSLADKVDALLPAQGIAESDAWKFTTYPFANAARGLSHMATLRNAVNTRQKLKLACLDPEGHLTNRIVRPLYMEYWGRVWTLTTWCETCDDFRVLRIDLIKTATPLPELFVDEPGKRLADHDARQQSLNPAP